MIANLTKKTVLCRKLELATTSFQRARGLMFRKTVEGGMLFVFEKERKQAIWTFGMLFPIDILWISRRKRVVHIKENAKPFLFCGGAEAASVLEVKSGTVARTRTTVGDAIAIRLPLGE